MVINRGVMLVCLAWAPLISMGQAAEDSSGGLVYVRKETRVATRDASLEATRKSMEALAQSTWHALGLTSDRSLPKSGLRGEVDVSLPVLGRDGQPLNWQPRADLADGEWNRLEGDLGWLYRTVEAERDQNATMTMGVDAMVKIYVNGVDEQSFSTTASMAEGRADVRIPLRRGTNHLLLLIGRTPMKLYYDLSPVPPEMQRTLEERLDEDFPERSEGRYYRLETIPVPRDVVLEVGGMTFDDEGRLAVATRRGEIWLYKDGHWRRFARGLHEPLGLISAGRGEFIVLQRPELTLVADWNKDGEADMFRTMADFWALSGGHHEYIFGPVMDSQRNLWGVISGLCDPNRASYCGWCFRVSPDGDVTPWCTGFRSPNGIVVTPDDEVFITDNQGEWVGTSPLYHVERGAFYGYPVGLRWDPEFKGDATSPDRDALDAMRKPAAVLFPYGAMGHSLSQPLVDTSGGKFGPFAGQMFVGDQSKCNVMRVTLEKVAGQFQGACYPFRSGFQSGNNRMTFGPDGSLYVGQTDRGWGSTGGSPYGLERLVWTREIPMEIESMSLREGGFALRLTKPLTTAGVKKASLSLQRYRYLYHASYGSPVVDREVVEVEGAQLVEEGRVILLSVKNLVTDRVYELHASGLEAADGTPLLHETAYYTLNRLVTSDPAP